MDPMMLAMAGMGGLATGAAAAGMPGMMFPTPSGGGGAQAAGGSPDPEALAREAGLDPKLLKGLDPSLLQGLDAASLRQAVAVSQMLEKGGTGLAADPTGLMGGGGLPPAPPSGRKPGSVDPAAGSQ